MICGCTTSLQDGKPVHEKCAWLWNTTIEIINKDKQLIPSGNYFQVHYENLIKDPTKVMASLYNQLGIPFENPQIELCKKVQNEMDGSYHSKVSEKWTVQNHSKRIGRYKENLNPKELEQVNQILGKLNSQLNYM